MSLLERIPDHRHPLLRTLAAGDCDEGAFWERAASLGTPLVEQDPSSPGHRLVTFLWRTNATERWVVLHIVAGAPAANLLARLHGTDVCHATYRIRSDVRMAYAFAPDMPLHDWDGADAAKLQALNDYLARQPPGADPLHPALERYRGEPGTPDLRFSILSLPDAPDESLVRKRDGIARGELHRATFTNAIMGNERRLWVYTPPGYGEAVTGAANTDHTLLLAFDGGMYVSQVPAHRMLDNLLADGRIAPTVAVFVDNATPTSRNDELPCSEAFARCLETELLPWVQANFRVTHDPARRFVTGFSYGGLAAMWMGHRLPHVFGNVIAQAPSLWWGPGHVITEPRNEGRFRGEWLVDEFERSARLPLRIWMEIGLLEHPMLMLASNRRMRRVLEAKGYDLTYLEPAGGHEPATWRGTLARALAHMLPRS